MSICKNVFRLNKIYDLVNSGCVVYDASSDPGTLWTWGNGIYGSTTSRSSPIQIPGTQWTFIASSRNGSAGALKSDGSLWMMGANGYGQLGDNSNTSKSSPIQIPGTSWSDVSHGNLHTLSLKSDGTLWSSGRNQSGELGINSLSVLRYSSPIQIPGTSWCKITAGVNNSMAVKTDGTMWVWGQNYDGQLGVNARNYLSSPTQVPGTSWVDVSTGYRTALARKTDGTLWSMGKNNYGSLGDSTNINRSSPVQIPGTAWNDISSQGTSGAGQFSMARKTDGTLWTWGCGRLGMLGTGNNSPQNSPVQVPGTQWSCIARGGYQQSFATKTDGTLWSWGANYGGTLGLNDTLHRSSPTQIPSSSWKKPSSGSSAFALKNT